MIGDEARAQILAQAGRLPARVVACVGGGSNAIGMFVAVRRRRRGRADRRRGRRRRDRHRPPRRAAHARRPRRRAARRLLGDHAGRGRPDPRGALDLGRPRLPRHRAASTRTCATPAAPPTRRSPTARRWPRSSSVAALEGIIPALESSHAVAWVLAAPRVRARPRSASRAAATRTSPRRSRRWTRREHRHRADRRRLRGRRDGHAALMPYLMGGFPDLDASLAIGEAYADGGADLVELGVPFSDPLADGPVIHAAGTRALAVGRDRPDVIELAARARGALPGRADVLREPRHGPRRRSASPTSSRERGVSGLIVPDLPLEESPRRLAACDAAGIALVPLVAPTTPEERLARDRRAGPRLHLHRLGDRHDRRARRRSTPGALLARVQGARDRPGRPRLRHRDARSMRPPRRPRAPTG